MFGQGSSSRRTHVTYSPANLVKIGYSPDREVRFIPSSFTTDIIRITNGSTYAGKQGNFTKVIIRESSSTGTIVNKIPFLDERSYTLPGDKRYYLELTWRTNSYDNQFTLEKSTTDDTLLLPIGATANVFKIIGYASLKLVTPRLCRGYLTCARHGEQLGGESPLRAW
jgi:hypothetical protein